MDNHDQYRMPFGKYKGHYIGEVPANYLVYLIEQPWLEKRWPEVHQYITLKEDQIRVEAQEEQNRGEAYK